MNHIKKVRIPSTRIVFTLTILCSCIWNIARGIYLNGFAFFVLEFFAFLVVMQTISAFIGKINFKKYIHYFLTEMLIYYGALLLFAYFGQWFSFEAGNLLLTTVIFWAIGVYVHHYFCSIQRAEAEEINKLLREV